MKNLKEISSRLKIAKQKNYSKWNTKKTHDNTSFGGALKISTELVAAVVVGTTIGFILDNLFDTKPWLIIIFFFIGVVAGILNVIKAANLMNKKNMRK